MIVSREMDACQQTSLRNQGKFLAETHEDVFDKLTMLVKQGFAKISRALLRPLGKSNYDAQGRNMSNVAAPVLPADAENRSFAFALECALVRSALKSLSAPTQLPS